MSCPSDFPSWILGLMLLLGALFTVWVGRFIWTDPEAGTSDRLAAMVIAVFGPVIMLGLWLVSP